MDVYLVVKTIHILSSTILFGTGIGIAFFMLRSHFTSDLNQKLYAVKNTVLADYLFTLPSVVMQPLTGFWLIHIAGYDITSKWLLITYVIYFMAGLCWVPVVWIQIQLKNILASCIEKEQALPAKYAKLFGAWCILGWPAFLGLVTVFFLMVFKPL